MNPAPSNESLDASVRLDFLELNSQNQLKNHEYIPIPSGSVPKSSVAGEGVSGDESFDLYRQKANTGEFSKLKESMQIENVKAVAEDAGIGLEGIQIKIDTNAELIGSGYHGYTSPDGNTITLYPDAFANRESLITTLGHERMHVYQLNTFGPVTDNVMGELYEQGAWASERSWLEYYKSINGGK